MTFREEAAVVRLWQQWSQDKLESNQTMIDFFFDVVVVRKKLAHCNAFEVFDAVTNAPLPEQAATLTKSA